MNWKPAKRLELDSKHMQELNIRLNIKYDRTDGIRVAFSCFHGKKIISCSRWIQQFIFEPAANEWNARCTCADKIDAPSFPKNEPRPSSGSRLKKPAPPGCGKIGTLPWGALLPKMRLVVCMAISRPFRFDGNTAGLFKV
jgi:hypothetical protein